MITLYGHPFSRAHRVLWLLKELGVAYDHVPTDFQHGGTKTFEFLRLNPNGRVPVLVHDGQPIFESMAINLYLIRYFGGPLAPQGQTEDGLALQWSFWAVTEIEKPLLLAAANRLLFPEPDRRANELSLALKRLDRPFAVLERHLAQSAYLLGDRFTIADLNVAALMSLIPIADVPMTHYPTASAWLARCLARPAAADWKPIRFTVPRPATQDGLLAMFL